MQFPEKWHSCRRSGTCSQQNSRRASTSSGSCRRWRARQVWRGFHAAGRRRVLSEGPLENSVLQPNQGRVPRATRLMALAGDISRPSIFLSAWTRKTFLVRAPLGVRTRCPATTAVGPANAGCPTDHLIFKKRAKHSWVALKAVETPSPAEHARVAGESVEHPQTICDHRRRR
jgi:hypothetical protein